MFISVSIFSIISISFLLAFFHRKRNVLLLISDTYHHKNLCVAECFKPYNSIFDSFVQQKEKS